MGRKSYKKDLIQTLGSELIGVQQQKPPLQIKDEFRMPNLETRNSHTISPEISIPEYVITALWNYEIHTALYRNTAAVKQSKVISLNRLISYLCHIERRIQVPDKECSFHWQNVRLHVNKPQNIPQDLQWPLVVTTKIAWFMIYGDYTTKQLWRWGLVYCYLESCKEAGKGN